MEGKCLCFPPQRYVLKNVIETKFGQIKPKKKKGIHL